MNYDFSKKKPGSIFPSINSLCDKCKAMEGTLGHLFWSCPTLRCFWEEIFNIYSWIYDLKLKPEGILAVLALRVWLCEMIAFLYIVEVRYGLANTHFKFFKIWNSFLNHIHRESTMFNPFTCTLCLCETTPLPDPNSFLDLFPTSFRLWTFCCPV